MAEQDRVYLAVADMGFNRLLIFAFLDKIKGLYTGENGSSFNSVLSQKMVRDYESANQWPNWHKG